jgi:hypothetical protein
MKRNKRSKNDTSGESANVKIVKIGTSMILCFYQQEVETFKEKHKIIDVPISS